MAAQGRDLHGARTGRLRHRGGAAGTQRGDCQCSEYSRHPRRLH